MKSTGQSRPCAARGTFSRIAPPSGGTSRGAVADALRSRSSRPSRSAKAQGDQVLAKNVLHRLAESEIDAERKHTHQLASRTCARSGSPPICLQYREQRQACISSFSSQVSTEARVPGVSAASIALNARPPTSMSSAVS